MTTDTTATTEDTATKSRAPKGSATPQERVHRATAVLRGLAADVLATRDTSLYDTYGAALDGVQRLETALKDVQPPTT